MQTPQDNTLPAERLVVFVSDSGRHIVVPRGVLLVRGNDLRPVRRLTFCLAYTVLRL